MVAPLVYDRVQALQPLVWSNEAKAKPGVLYWDSVRPMSPACLLFSRQRFPTFTFVWLLFVTLT